MAGEAWREFDAETLEREYDNRAAVPGCMDMIAAWQAASGAYRGRAKAELDVAYGEGAGETVDLFLPEAAGGPVHMFIHGGYWRLLDKGDFSYLAEPVVAAGAAVAMTNYALCPEVTVTEIVRQQRAAAAWLWRNAAEFGADPNRIHISGHSAGGHLAAMLMATDWPAFDDDLPVDLVKSGIAISGVFELEPLLGVSTNDDLRMDEAEALANSPVLLSPATDAPLVVCAGAGELGEFTRQSRDFAASWKEKGAPVEHFELPGEDHFTIVDGMADPDDPITRVILKQMGLG